MDTPVDSERPPNDRCDSMRGFDTQADSFDTVQLLVAHTLADADGVLPLVGKVAADAEGDAKVV